MRLILTKPHTHAGRDRLPGEVIDVDETLEDWLIERGVGRVARRSRSPRPASAAVPNPASDPVPIEVIPAVPPTESNDP